MRRFSLQRPVLATTFPYRSWWRIERRHQSQSASAWQVLPNAYSNSPLASILSFLTFPLYSSQIPILNRVDIGNRTLIISADDPRSQDLSKRMWFEMQKVGIEAGFYTTKTAFCCSASVQEGLEIVRRTGIHLFSTHQQHTHIHTDFVQHTFTHIDYDYLQVPKVS